MLFGCKVQGDEGDHDQETCDQEQVFLRNVDGIAIHIQQDLILRSILDDHIADQGADQCGFCNPGFVMNTIALLRENPDPTDDEIRAFLAGNLCRCSGYDSQLRGIRKYLDSRKG